MNRQVQARQLVSKFSSAIPISTSHSSKTKCGKKGSAKAHGNCEGHLWEFTGLDTVVRDMAIETLREYRVFRHGSNLLDFPASYCGSRAARSHSSTHGR